MNWFCLHKVFARATKTTLLFLVLHLAGCDQSDVFKSTVPKATFSKYYNAHLPKSADQFFIATFSGGMQIFEQCMRFSIQSSDLDETINEITKKAHNESLDTKTFTTIKCPNVEHLGNPTWWHPEHIKEGKCYSTEDLTTRVWVDTSTNPITLFVYRCD